MEYVVVSLTSALRLDGDLNIRAGLVLVVCKHICYIKIPHIAIAPGEMLQRILLLITVRESLVCTLDIAQLEEIAVPHYYGIGANCICACL